MEVGGVGEWSPVHVHNSKLLKVQLEKGVAVLQHVLSALSSSCIRLYPSLLQKSEDVRQLSMVLQLT